MRQLDLFASLFNAEEVKEQEQIPAQPQAEPAAVAGSVVAIAEEVFVADVKESAATAELFADGLIVHHLQAEEEMPAIEVATIEVEKVEHDTPPASPAGDNSSVVFSDGKIAVKIKAKPQPQVVIQEVVEPAPLIETPAPVVKKPATKASLLKEVKAKKEKVKRPPQKRGRKSFKEIDAELDLVEVPDDEILFQKQYYPISEVAKWFRVNTSLLRFWSNEFDVLKPRKNRKGDRLFRPEDVKNLQLIYQLLRNRKFTVEGAKDYLKANKKKADVQLHLTQTLQKFKSFLLELKANLQA